MPRHNTTSDKRAGNAGEGLALSQAFGVLRRSWVWIAVPTLVAALGAGVFVQVAPPRYTGEAKVLLESRDPAFARTASERSEPAQAIDEQAVASQVQVAMSRDIARQAVRALGLVGKEEFDPTVGEIGPLKQALMMIGLVRNPLSGSPEDRALDAYFDRLLVYPVGKSRILAFEFRSRDPELAAKAANTIAELYIASLAAAQVDTARYASTWLGSNIDALRARVVEAEAKVEAFRAKNGLIGAGVNQPLSAQQLGELSSQLSQARTIRADLVGRVKILKDMIKEGRAFDIPDVANNELIRRTVESRMSLRAQLALESRTLLPAHPRIKELTAQVTDLEAQIKAASERIVRTMENDAKIAGARVDSLQAAVDGQSAVVVKGNGSEVELRALEREAKVQREQLESYLSRYREATARDGESASPADARIVSRAVVPDSSSFPKKVPTFAVAVILAFLLSAGAVVGRHLLATPPDRPRGQRREDEEDRVVADPERLIFPEPFASGPGRFAPQPAAASAVEPFVVAAAFGGAAAPTPDGEPARERPARPAAVEAAPEEPVLPTVQPVPSPKPAPIVVARDAERDQGYDFALLIERLREGTRHGGHSVLVVETARTGTGTGMAQSLARLLSEEATTLCVDVNGADGETDALGLPDLVAGEAFVEDAIHAEPGSRLHAMAAGLTDCEILVEEPQGLAITLNALAQAYDWVICRIRTAEDELAPALIAAFAASMDSVVIASDAQGEDEDLVALHDLAEEAGAGQVLVAQHREVVRRRPSFAEIEMSLRSSAA